MRLAVSSARLASLRMRSVQNAAWDTVSMSSMSSSMRVMPLALSISRLVTSTLSGGMGMERSRTASESWMRSVSSSDSYRASTSSIVPMAGATMTPMALISVTCSCAAISSILLRASGSTSSSGMPWKHGSRALASRSSSALLG